MYGFTFYSKSRIQLNSLDHLTSLELMILGVSATALPRYTSNQFSLG